MIENNKMIVGTHCCSSSSWGDQATARLCKFIVDSNTAVSQQIIESRHDLLDLLSYEQLLKPDEDGLTLTFLCVYYDRPEMLQYLSDRTLDLREPCDPIRYGTPMFYAVAMRRYDVILKLIELGIDIKKPCDTFNTTPLHHANRIGDLHLRDQIKWLCESERRAWNMLRKNFLRAKHVRQYKYMRSIGIPLLQRAMRGMFGRTIYKEKARKRNAAIKKIQREERIRLGMVVDEEEEDEVEAAVDAEEEKINSDD